MHYKILSLPQIEFESNIFHEPVEVVLDRKENQGRQWLVEYSNEIKWTVRVQNTTLGGLTNNHEFGVTDCTPVEDLRALVAEKQNCCMKDVQMSFQHALLRDGQTLAEAGLYADALIKSL